MGLFIFLFICGFSKCDGPVSSPMSLMKQADKKVSHSRLFFPLSCPAAMLTGDAGGDAFKGVLLSDMGNLGAGARVYEKGCEASNWKGWRRERGGYMRGMYSDMSKETIFKRAEFLRLLMFITVKREINHILFLQFTTRTSWGRTEQGKPTDLEGSSF